MRHLSDEAPEVREDPVVEVRESQLRWLTFRAWVGSVALLVALAAASFTVQVSIRQASRNKAINDRISTIVAAQAKQNKDLGDSIAKKTDPTVIAKIATDASAARFAGMKASVDAALATATATADSLGPLAVRVTTLEGQTETQRTNLLKVTNTVSANTKALVDADGRLKEVKQQIAVASETAAYKLKSIEGRLDDGEQQLKKLSGKFKLLLVNTVLTIPPYIHMFGHGGRK